MKEDLADAVIKTAVEDLIKSESIFELKINMRFFESDAYEFWCDVAGYSVKFRDYLRRRIRDEIYEVVKAFIYLTEKYAGKFICKEGKLIAYGCKKRILYCIFHSKVSGLFKKHTHFRVFDNKVVFFLKGDTLTKRCQIRL